MRRLAEITKTTLLGGVLVVLPLWVSVLLLSKALMGMLALVSPVDVLPTTTSWYRRRCIEYVPRNCFAETLRGLCDRLIDGGHFVLFVTRRNPLTRLLIGRWWQSNLYTAPELRDAFMAAGFTRVRFPGFPFSARYLATWGHVVEADR